MASPKKFVFLNIILLWSGIAQAQTITTQPKSQTVQQGQSVRFSVTATGSPLSYRWYKNGAAISNATSQTYSISSAKTTDAGRYHVVVRRRTRSVTSNTVTLVVNSPVENVSKLDSANYLNWLLKSVCVNSQGQLVTADPYYNCPTGTVLRKIRAGDAIPFNNMNQFNYQINDSFVLLDNSGGPLYLHNFDYFPFNEYNQHSGSDGYDVYKIADGVVSVSNTKDGGGYSTTFFGAGCKPYGGWVIFPSTGFLTGGQNYWPISGVYWEHTGQASPGSCPAGYSTNTLTSWNYLTVMSFGGINGNPTKAMQTIVSYHGYETHDGVTATPNFKANGHLEVFYYTREYGLTRWEVWTPTEQAMVGTNKHECNGPNQKTYKGSTFNIQWCHDWSDVIPATASNIPKWPIENSNLLQHAHFDSGLSDIYLGYGYWHRFGNSLDGYLLNWTYSTSTAGADGWYGTGIQYLSTNCGATSLGCGPAGTQAIYQDVPINQFCSHCTYLYGVQARTRSGAGTVYVAVQLVGLNGTVIWQDVTGGTVVPDNGDGRPGEAETVYRSVKFVHKTATLPSVTGAAYVRFLILPTTPETFDILDATLNRFPEMTTSVGL
ncbi:MAG: immunoglobulin domain-containing protein [Pseudobdellovibrionaceae bacterium]